LVYYLPLPLPFIKKIIWKINAEKYGIMVLVLGFFWGCNEKHAKVF
jgi:hypothetical protein